MNTGARSGPVRLMAPASVIISPTAAGMHFSFQAFTSHIALHYNFAWNMINSFSFSFITTISLHLFQFALLDSFIQWLLLLPLPVGLMQDLEVLPTGLFVHWVPNRLQVSRELGPLVEVPSMGVALQAHPRRAPPCFPRGRPNQEAPLLDSMLTRPHPLEQHWVQHLEVLEQQVCAWIPGH